MMASKQFPLKTLSYTAVMYETHFTGRSVNTATLIIQLCVLLLLSHGMELQVH